MQGECENTGSVREYRECVQNHGTRRRHGVLDSSVLMLQQKLMNCILLSEQSRLALLAHH